MQIRGERSVRAVAPILLAAANYAKLDVHCGVNCWYVQEYLWRNGESVGGAAWDVLCSITWSVFRPVQPRAPVSPMPRP